MYKIQLYLETGPKKEFVESEKEKLKKRIENIKNGYRVWVDSRPNDGKKNLESLYKREMGLKVLTDQLRMINIILR
jgi:D-Tyr-tRNAtyr deacylase